MNNHLRCTLLRVSQAWVLETTWGKQRRRCSSWWYRRLHDMAVGLVGRVVISAYVRTPRDQISLSPWPVQISIATLSSFTALHEHCFSLMCSQLRLYLAAWDEEITKSEFLVQRIANASFWRWGGRTGSLRVGVGRSFPARGLFCYSLTRLVSAFTYPCWLWVFFLPYTAFLFVFC